MRLNKPLETVLNGLAWSGLIGYIALIAWIFLKEC